MSIYVSAVLQDVNGDKATVGSWVADDAGVTTYLTSLQAMSNAKLISAEKSRPVALQTIINNTPSATNNESAKTKAKVKMRGADLGSTAQPFDEVELAIVAPIGTLINGKYGDTTNADLQALKGYVLSNSGVQMDIVSEVKYARAK